MNTVQITMQVELPDSDVEDFRCNFEKYTENLFQHYKGLTKSVRIVDQDGIPVIPDPAPIPADDDPDAGHVPVKPPPPNPPGRQHRR